MLNLIFAILGLSLSEVQIMAEPPDANLFSSISEMAHLARLELELVSKMNKYLQLIDHKQKSIRHFIENKNKHTEDNPQEKRFDILNKDDGKLWEEIKEKVGDLPGIDELIGASQGIFLLQETYNLNVSEFAAGIVHLAVQGEERYKSESIMSQDDAEYIGKVAYNRAFYDRAVEWFKGALMIEQGKGVKTNRKKLKVLKNLLATTMKNHDTVLDKKGAQGFDENDNTWRTNLVPFDEKLRKKKKYKKLIKAGLDKEPRFVPKLFNKQNETESWEHFNRLCRGVKMRSPSMDIGLKCYFLHYHDPYLRLGPFKLDVQNENPFLTVFRDFFAETEMEHFKEYARPRLFRSEHGTSTNADTNSAQQGEGSTNKRTSKQTWLTEVSPPGLQDLEEIQHNVRMLHYTYKNFTTSPYHKRKEMELNDELALGVADRIKMATRTYTAVGAGGEAFQIANYGIGGVYNHHPDSSNLHHPSRQPLPQHKRPEALAWGDRLATFMAYLSDVQLGGATVFPNLGITIWPEKGSAAFWWNLVGKGLTHQFTMHGGCPVLVGSKWITNKWIRWMAQGLNIPCLRENNGFTIIPGLHNDVCYNPPTCKPNMNHETFLVQHDYYQHLKQFSSEFQ